MDALPLKWVRFQWEGVEGTPTEWAAPVPGAGLFTIDVDQPGSMHPEYTARFEPTGSYGEKVEFSMALTFSLTLPAEPWDSTQNTLAAAKEAAQTAFDTWRH